MIDNGAAYAGASQVRRTSLFPGVPVKFVGAGAAGWSVVTPITTPSDSPSV